MLVLGRKVNEEIRIGDNIVVVVNKISGNRVSIGIAAPDDVSIVRGEIPQRGPEQEHELAAVPMKIAPIAFELDLDQGVSFSPNRPR